MGGADFRIAYTAGNGDPTGNSVHWIQAIYTDSPLSAGAQAVAYNAGGGLVGAASLALLRRQQRQA